jgi:hypothetical protein
MQSPTVPRMRELDASEMAAIDGGCEWVCDVGKLAAKGVKAVKRAAQAVRKGFDRMIDALNN